VTCRDVKATLARVGTALAQYGLEPHDVQTEEPNLEQVFLHHTKRDIRD
jgi:hypothetical protein